MKANKNRWIEKWGSGPENLEHNFHWTLHNFALVGGISGNEQDTAQQPPSKKKRYHRHTAHQIQEMEAYELSTEVDPTVEHEDTTGTDGKESFISDLSNAIPEIDEAMRFDGMLKYELGRQPANTKLSSNKTVRRVRVRGGNVKWRALRVSC
ncbi:hypothetical protein AgCh_013556 [Apium graveolens]